VNQQMGKRFVFYVRSLRLPYFDQKRRTLGSAARFDVLIATGRRQSADQAARTADLNRGKATSRCPYAEEMQGK